MEVADYTLYNGTVVTMSEKPTTQSALAVRGDTIIAVGDSHLYQRQKELKCPKMVDLEGKVVMPGLIESHTHAIEMINKGITFQDVNIHGYEFDKVKELMSEQIKRAKQKGGNKSVIFFGWNVELMAAASGGIDKIPSLQSVDLELCDPIEEYFHTGDVAVMVIAASFHIAWANNKALGNLKCTRKEKADLGIDTKTGALRKVDGIFKMIGANRLEPTSEDVEKAIADVMKEYRKAGFTSATELAYDDENEFSTLVKVRLSSHKDWYVRLFYYSFQNPPNKASKGCCSPSLPSNGSGKPKGSQQQEEEDNDDNLFCKKVGVKLFTDGSPHSGSMAISEPDKNYRDNAMTRSLEFPSKGALGKLIYTEEQFKNAIDKHKNEGQIAIHAHGQEACEQILQAFEGMSPTQRGGKRHRIEHLGNMTAAQIERARDLALGLSFNVNILYHYGKVFSEEIFTEESGIVDAWAPCGHATGYDNWTLHQDHPAHPYGMQPFRSIQTAVTRIPKGETKPRGAEFCVTIYEALKAYTINAAVQLGADRKLGSLEKGKYADLLVLQKNPLDFQDHAHELHTLDDSIVGTIVAGRTPHGMKFQHSADGDYVIVKD